jgi:hypothetical protein
MSASDSLFGKSGKSVFWTFLIKLPPRPVNGEAGPRGFGVRREAKRHAAFARTKAPSPLRSAVAVQKRQRAKIAVSGDRTKKFLIPP